MKKGSNGILGQINTLLFSSHLYGGQNLERKPTLGSCKGLFFKGLCILGQPGL